MRRRIAVLGAESADDTWELLPFRFHRMPGARVLLTNVAGEHLVLGTESFSEFVSGALRDPEILRRLRARHIIRDAGDPLPIDLLAMKVRTRQRRLSEFTSLHIFVVTLRCEHTCRYCQVSRQTSDRSAFDMTRETAVRALDATFASPSSQIKIEFQGGEPLLNLELIEYVIDEARRRNAVLGRDLSFVIATNLALMNDQVLAFCRRNDVLISTSLDGPEDLHNHNRRRPGRDSWQRTVDGIREVRRALGPEYVSALMTTTEASLGRVREIIDCYVDQGLNGIFLRPLSPYGFAVTNRSYGSYDLERWLAFYEEGLDYIIEINRRGTDLVEFYAATILKKMLTNDDPGYVDLMSPAGIGLGALVYNYDGEVYASDEGRMLAEMGDTTFRLGNLHRDSYETLLTSDALLDPLEQSMTTSAPMCCDCAFEPYCGADPVFHHATLGDYVGRKPESFFCQRNMAICEMLLNRYEADERLRELFRTWAAR